MIDCRLPTVSITEASDSSSGLEKVKSFLPYLVFVDIHLPGIDGLAYVKMIKQLSPDSVIIVFSYYDIPEYHEKVNQIGADHFIPKDMWRGEEMLNLVESIIRVRDTD